MNYHLLTKDEQRIYDNHFNDSDLQILPPKHALMQKCLESGMSKVDYYLENNQKIGCSYKQFLSWFYSSKTERMYWPEQLKLSIWREFTKCCHYDIDFSKAMKAGLQLFIKEHINYKGIYCYWQCTLRKWPWKIIASACQDHNVLDNYIHPQSHCRENRQLRIIQSSHSESINAYYETENDSESLFKGQKKLRKDPLINRLKKMEITELTDLQLEEVTIVYYIAH